MEKGKKTGAFVLLRHRRAPELKSAWGKKERVVGEWGKVILRL
jgi:hypothetical protein